MINGKGSRTLEGLYMKWKVLKLLVGCAIYIVASKPVSFSVRHYKVRMLSMSMKTF